jgi:hypothetical protein
MDEEQIPIKYFITGATGFVGGVAGVTYVGNNGKAKRELGYNPRPVNEGWTDSVRHEMKLLEML